jgi:hypothetical protein
LIKQSYELFHLFFWPLYTLNSLIVLFRTKSPKGNLAYSGVVLFLVSLGLIFMFFRFALSDLAYSYEYRWHARATVIFYSLGYALGDVAQGFLEKLIKEIKVETKVAV